MKFEYTKLKELTKKYGTSFYIFDKGLFVSNFRKFKKCFEKYYPKVEIAYAYKANYMPTLGDLIATDNGMIEVVSDLEYEIALKSISANKIIFNGPVKTKYYIKKTLLNNSILHIDSMCELKYIKELLEDNEIKKASIGIRINFNVLNYKSRFGFNVENGDLDKVIKLIENESRINLISIHSHFTTKERSLDVFAIRSKKMAEVYKKLIKKHKIRYIDIGGGFFGEMPNLLSSKFNSYIPSFDEYAKCISSTIRNEIEEKPLPTLIVEPGIALVGNTMSYVTQVLEIKRINGINYAICDSNVNVVNPTRSSIEPFFYVVNSENCISNDEYLLVGNTCMENDILVNSYKGPLSVGSFIVFENRGAYSSVFAPNFIMPAPPIIGLDGEVYKIRDNADSILRVYEYNKKGQ